MRSRQGFTLIELVASAVLTAMMMAGLMSIVWSSVRESNQLQKTEVSRFDCTQLVDQMRLDFHNARGMLIENNAVTLHGFLGRDPAAGTATLTPETVRYELRSVADRRVLQRTSGSYSEPVWVGLRAMQVVPLAFTETAEDALPLPETGNLPVIPASFQVALIGDDGRVLFREVIHHHAW